MEVLYIKGIVHRDLKPQNLLLSHKESRYPPPTSIQIKIGIFLKLKLTINFFDESNSLLNKFSRFWVRTLFTRWRYGSYIMWVTNVYGSRSDNVDSVRWSCRSMEFRNDCISVFNRQSSVPGEDTDSFKAFLRTDV